MDFLEDELTMADLDKSRRKRFVYFSPCQTKAEDRGWRLTTDSYVPDPDYNTKPMILCKAENVLSKEYAGSNFEKSIYCKSRQLGRKVQDPSGSLEKQELPVKPAVQECSQGGCPIWSGQKVK